MSNGQVTIGVDVRHWVTFSAKDLTDEESELLSGDTPESLELLREIVELDRLTLVQDDQDDCPDYFSADQNASIIEATAAKEGD